MKLIPGKLYSLNWKKLDGATRMLTNIFYWNAANIDSFSKGTNLTHNSSDQIFLYIGFISSNYHIFLYKDIKIYFETFINSKPEKWLVEAVDS